MSKNFETFAELPVNLQKEAILKANGCSTRSLPPPPPRTNALLVGPALIAAATAALGGGVALFNKEPADLLLGYISILFGISFLKAAWTAVQTVRPSKFGFPGNWPENWLPAEWDCNGMAKEKEQTARTEQAHHINDCICENRDMAADKAKAMHRSFQWALWSIMVAGGALLITVTARQAAVRESVLEVVRSLPTGGRQ